MPKVNQETAEALTELIRKGLVKIVINEDGEVVFKLTASRLIKIEVRKNGSGLKFE